MAQPVSRQTLKDYCLRRLGHPVIKVNVDDAQIEDRLDDALQFFAEYHFDGVERMFFPYQILQTDIDNKYINTDTISPSIISITRVFRLVKRVCLQQTSLVLAIRCICKTTLD